MSDKTMMTIVESALMGQEMYEAWRGLPEWIPSEEAARFNVSRIALLTWCMQGNLEFAVRKDDLLQYMRDVVARLQSDATIPHRMTIEQAMSITGWRREFVDTMLETGGLRLSWEGLINKEDICGILLTWIGVLSGFRGLNGRTLGALREKANELREREADLPEWLSIGQAAKITGFSRAYIESLVRREALDINSEGQIETNGLIEWMEFMVRVYEQDDQE